MKPLVEQLSQYASYHRDRRNIATHFVGIPMIVCGMEALLARVSLAPGSALSLALASSLAAGVFYLALDGRYGVAMTAFLGAGLWIGTSIASLPTTEWLIAFAGLFVLGWVIQFVGHAFEGRKPAFVDDLVGLVIGPLFIVAEVGFALGCRDGVRREIERRVGPTGRFSLGNRIPGRSSSAT
jgi:uncharacterized membrane protein YGL010W